MAQAVITKFIGATNSRGSRIQIKSWFGTKYYSFDHAAECAHKAAFDKWLKEANDKMRAEMRECDGDWYKLVAKGAHPDGSGYCFIIQ